jgi:hypothetical protein
MIAIMPPEPRPTVVDHSAMSRIRFLLVAAGGKFAGCEFEDIDGPDLQFLLSKANGPYLRSSIIAILRERNRYKRKTSRAALRRRHNPVDTLLGG